MQEFDAQQPHETEVPPTAAFSRWRENQGTLILGVVTVVCVVGFAILFYQQSRFSPPRFPSREMIESGQQFIDSDPVSIVQPGLKVRVSGAINDSGNIRIAIYDSAESFNDPEQAFLKKSQVGQMGVAEFAIGDDLPQRVAVAAYHDENDDDALSRNAIGIPTERYGFSNDARGTFGPPTFDEAAIDLAPDNPVLEIFIR